MTGKSCVGPYAGESVLRNLLLLPRGDVNDHCHALESRSALHALTRRAEWREDALVARFEREILPHIDGGALALEPLLQPSSEHGIPARLGGVLDALR